MPSETSYTKGVLATRIFKKMKAISRFEYENCCMDLASVDKLAKDHKRVKYSVVGQDLFDRTVDAKGRKTKDFKESVGAISNRVTKKNRPKKLWVDTGTEFSGEFKRFCSAAEVQNYSTMSETKAAFAKRKIRSLKNFLHHNKEDYEHKNIHNLSQFIKTVTSRNKPSIDLTPKIFKDSDFLSFVYSKSLRDYRKTKFKSGDKVRIQKYDLPFSKRYTLKFTQEVFEIVAISSRKPPT